jgi:hypothetical protein
MEWLVGQEYIKDVDTVAMEQRGMQRLSAIEFFRVGSQGRRRLRFDASSVEDSRL